ncbi:hypothetical protein EYF80_038886 [Liparis tanakae]|uniref:Uncharacterized protein n=1 Tax=Liparis tanakae TaxID=230148 RepID=A0A4Z2GCQ2_9TELE|nr:hypothetical protein EYF80_038886 [Liparis tanakae]
MPWEGKQQRGEELGIGDVLYDGDLVSRGAGPETRRSIRTNQGLRCVTMQRQRSTGTPKTTNQASKRRNIFPSRGYCTKVGVDSRLRRTIFLTDESVPSRLDNSTYSEVIFTFKTKREGHN